MKLTLEVYSTSAGDAGGAPSFGVRIRDRRALEAGALYDPLDVNFLVDREFIPAPETVAVSIYRPSEDGGPVLVATTAGSAFAPVPGHSMMHRGVLATATQGFDSWYEETRCPDGDHTYPVPVFSILEVKWSCGAEDCMARAGAVPAILTPIGVRAVRGLDGTDGEDGKTPTVEVTELGDGSYRMTVTSPDGTEQTVKWRDGIDGDGAVFPAPVSPDDATAPDQYADAQAVQGILDRIRKDLSGVLARLDVLDSLTGVESLDSIREILTAKVDKVDGYGLVSTGAGTALEDFIGTYGKFGGLAGIGKVTSNELGDELAGRLEALEAAVESIPSTGGGGTLDSGYVTFLDAVIASGDNPAQRILGAVDLVLAESNDAGTGIWKAVNANAKGLADLEAKVGSGGSSSIPAELEAMIRNSVQKDAFGRGFSSNDFTQEYIDRINNSVQMEAGKGLSTVDFTMERAERLDALYNSSSTLNPPVKPDENAKQGQPADAKDTYEVLKGLSLTTAPDSYGSEWHAELGSTPGGVWTFVTRPSLEWRTSTVTGDSAWYVTPFTVKLSSSDVPVPDSALGGAYLLPGTYSSERTLPTGSYDRNLDGVDCACYITGVGTTAGEPVRISIQVRFHRELYVYKGDSYVTKTYVDERIADEIGKIELPEPDVTLPDDLGCVTLHAAASVTVGSRSSADTPGQSSFSSGRGNIASGDHSHAEGDSVIAKGLNSHAEGCTTKAEGNCSHAEGKFTEASGAYSHAAGFRAKAQQRAYAWSGVESATPYESNGDGTYNINPVGGIEGFYVGEKNLKTIISEGASAPELSGYVKKTASGGISLELQYNDDMESPPLFLDIEGAVRMGQPSTAGDEALLEMQAGGRPGGFKVLVTPSYDESAGEDVSRTTVSIDDISDVAAELRKISAKRDRTDNIAVATSYSSKWNVSYEIYSDSEELKAKLALWFSNTPTSISGSDSEGWSWNNLPVIEGYYKEGDNEIEGAYARTTYASGTDLFGFSIIGQRPTVVTPGEPYVTPTGVKALAPKTELHSLVPEISEGKVTLRPADEKANWVEGTVTAGSPGKRAFRIVAYCEAFYVDYENDDHLTVKWKFEFSDKNSEFVSIRKFEDPVLVIRLTDLVIGAVTESDPPYISNGTYPLELLKGVELDFYLGDIDLSEGEFDWGSTDLNSESFSAEIYGGSLFESLESTFPTFMQGGGHSYSLESAVTGTGSYVEHTAPKTSAAFSISLPGGTGPARHFSLALTTEVEKETDVTWEGATKIIEAFPGASKLISGEVIWGVKEVAPGKMLVNRTPGASGGSVTLTSESGSNYELTVNNDGELEVKES